MLHPRRLALSRRRPRSLPQAEAAKGNQVLRRPALPDHRKGAEAGQVAAEQQVIVAPLIASRTGAVRGIASSLCSEFRPHRRPLVGHRARTAPLAGAAIPVIGIPVIALDAMAKGVPPVERLFAFVVLADVVDRLPIRAHGETAGSKAINCLDQLRKILFRHVASSRFRLSISQPCGKPDGAVHFVGSSRYRDR
ncbi:hypothetical protein CUJ84_Chr001758 [Rhizobium leguminosarum]|uniref:Uncharacterized protein n=1 Tax=Rhizobium leguminosarum TaxID=384 RepID=A0A2K9Z1M8_RHILE|nr:hypothetical protein CUJ84_Chr001758 [Rhizobium leguminosarum]